MAEYYFPEVSTSGQFTDPRVIADIKSKAKSAVDLELTATRTIAQSAADRAEVASGDAAAIRDGLEPRVQSVEVRQTAIESAAEFGPSTPSDGTMASYIVRPDTLTRSALNEVLDMSVRGAGPVGEIEGAGDIEVPVPLSSTQARTMYAVVIAEKKLATGGGGWNVVRFGDSAIVEGRFVFVTKPQTTILEASFATRGGQPLTNVPLGGPGVGIGVPTIIWASADDLSNVDPAIRVGGESGTVIGEARGFAIGDGFGGGLWKRDLKDLFRVPYAALYHGSHTLEERRSVIRRLRAKFPFPEMEVPQGPESNTLTDFRNHSIIPDEWTTEDTTWGIVHEVLRDTRST